MSESANTHRTYRRGARTRLCSSSCVQHVDRSMKAPARRQNKEDAQIQNQPRDVLNRSASTTSALTRYARTRGDVSPVLLVVRRSIRPVLKYACAKTGRRRIQRTQSQQLRTHVRYTHALTRTHHPSHVRIRTCDARAARVGRAHHETRMPPTAARRTLTCHMLDVVLRITMSSTS